MEPLSIDSVTCVRISLRVDDDPHFLIVLDANGRVKRVGYSDLSRLEEEVVTGVVSGAFQQVVAAVPPGLLGRAGSYEDPGTVGYRCQWRLDFEGDAGEARFELRYHSGSAGLPAAIARLVDRAESSTDAWYAEHLGPVPEPEAVPVAPDAPAWEPTAGPPVAHAQPSVRSPWTIGEYLSFEGRIGRADYLVHYVLPLMALSFAGGFADGLVGLGGTSQIGPMGLAATLLTLWPSMAGWAKRLHDFDTSLWVVPGLMVGGGVLVGIGMALSPWMALVAGGMTGLAFLALFAATYLRPGTDGPNQYGSPPISSRG